MNRRKMLGAVVGIALGAIAIGAVAAQEHRGKAALDLLAAIVARNTARPNLAGRASELLAAAN